MSNDMSHKEIAARIYAILVLSASKLQGFSDLFDVFNELAATVSAKEAAIIQIFGELVAALPKETREELHNIVTEEGLGGTYKGENGSKSLETLIREILRDNRKGGDN